MKVCSSCKLEKPLQDFSKRTSSKDGLYGACKECARAMSKRHYENNKRYYLNRNTDSKTFNREKIWSFLKQNPCVDCGEKNPLLLEFDHLRDKTKNVAHLIGSTWPRIEQEIKKCEVVCANCHRTRTYKRADTWFYRKWLEENPTE